MAAGAGGQYRVNLVWTSHGGQVLATMGQIQGGMRMVGGSSVREGRNLGYFNRQMQAVGTTLRYMFAGGAIFGGLSAFRQFAEFQGALGDIAAISEQLNRGDITNLGNKLLGISSDIAAPVGELQQSARNIQSTMQLTREEANRFLPEFVELFGSGAKVAESDAYNFGNAIMGMRNAFDLALTDMNNIAGQFFTVIQKSAGMTGDEWAKFSGRVVAGAGIAGASLEEMNALMVLMTRQGGTPATNVRHLAQFLMRLRDPTQETAPRWREIGLGPEELQTMPFSQIIGRLRQAVQEAGGISRGRKLSEEAIAALEEEDQITPAALGIKGGGATLLTDLFGRMESRRAALVVLSEMLSPPKEGLESHKELLDVFRDQEKQAKALDTAFGKWLDRNRIKQAGIALRNMLTEALVPAENRIRGIAEAITRHADPRYAQMAAGALAGYGAYRVGRFGFEGVRGLARLARGLGPAGIAITQAGAAPSGSFANPFWVIIHPLSSVPGLGGAVIPGGGGRGPGGGGGKPYTKYGRRMALGGGALGILGVGAALAMTAPDDVRDRISLQEYMDKPEPRTYPANQQRLARLRRITGRPLSMAQMLLAQDVRAGRIPMSSIRAGEMMPGGYQLNEEAARAIRAAARGMGGGGLTGGLTEMAKGFISGQRGADETNVRISVDASAEAKRLLDIRTSTSGARKRTSVPVGHSAWKGGAIPQFRGQGRSIRSGR